MNEYYMDLAIKEAKKAIKHNEVPVGAIIVYKNKVIAKAYNKIEKKNNALQHAELIVINKASKKLKNWRLDTCTLYVTMEPCMMCCGAIIQSRIKKVVYGVENGKFGCSKMLKNIIVEKNVLSKECLSLIQSFFKNKRITNVSRETLTKNKFIL